MNDCSFIECRVAAAGIGGNCQLTMLAYNASNGGITLKRPVWIRWAMDEGGTEVAVRSGDKYGLILDAAEAVFARQGYHNAQIARIAAEAGVAAGTIYLYFKNKPDLLCSLFRDRLGLLIEEARRILASVTDPREKLHLFIGLHLRELSRRRDLAVLTQIELRQADAAVQAEIRSIMKGYFQVIDEIIAEGQREGRFRRVAEPKQIRNLIFGTLDQSMTAWVMSGFKFDLAELTEPTFLLVTGGVCESDQKEATT